MAVLQFNPDVGAYQLESAKVTTLEDVTELKGEAARPVGSAEIVLDLDRLGGVSTEGQFRDRVLEDAGGPVQVQYVDQDGVLYPADFHSLNLATAYYNFERARLYALDRGMDPSVLRSVPFYYFPQVILDEADGGYQVDNAAWFPLLRSFVLYPFDSLQAVPLAMNQGVIAHEYGHGIFHAEVHGGAWLPPYLERWCPGGNCRDEAGYQRGARMLGAIEEGFADAWAVGVTGDPRFTHHSLLGLGNSRDPDRFDPQLHCYSQAAYDREQADTAAFSAADREQYWGYRQYEIGTVFAGALYRAGQEPGTDYDRVIDALLASYRSAGPGSLASLIAEDDTGASLGSLANIASAVILGAPDTDTARALCAAFLDRLALDPADLGGRCDGVASLGACG